MGPSAVGGAINSRPSGAFQFLSNGQGFCGIGIGEDRRRHIHRNGSCAQERWPGPLYVCAKSLQSCLTLWDPMGRSPPGFSVQELLQAKYWSGLPCPPPGDLPDPGIEPASLGVY